MFGLFKQELYISVGLMATIYAQQKCPNVWAFKFSWRVAKECFTCTSGPNLAQAVVVCGYLNATPFRACYIIDTETMHVYSWDSN